MKYLILFQPACAGNGWGFQIGPLWFYMNKPWKIRNDMKLIYGWGWERPQ